jgi:hypothetical protein
LGQGRVELRFEGEGSAGRWVTVQARGFKAKKVEVGPRDAPKVVVRLGKAEGGKGGSPVIID